MMGRVPAQGIGFTTKALLAAPPAPPRFPAEEEEEEESCAATTDVVVDGDDPVPLPFLLRRLEPRSLRPLGDLRKLDLKLSRPGNLTIHDGATIILALQPIIKNKNPNCKLLNGNGHRHLAECIQTKKITKLLAAHNKNKRERDPPCLY